MRHGPGRHSGGRFSGRAGRSGPARSWTGAGTAEGKRRGRRRGQGKERADCGVVLRGQHRRGPGTLQRVAGGGNSSPGRRRLTGQCGRRTGLGRADRAARLGPRKRRGPRPRGSRPARRRIAKGVRRLARERGDAAVGSARRAGRGRVAVRPAFPLSQPGLLDRRLRMRGSRFALGVAERGDPFRSTRRRLAAGWSIMRDYTYTVDRKIYYAEAKNCPARPGRRDRSITIRMIRGSISLDPIAPPWVVLAFAFGLGAFFCSWATSFADDGTDLAG